MSHIDLNDRRRRAARLRLAQLLAIRRATLGALRERDLAPATGTGSQPQR